MSHPLISVICLCYNQQAFVGAAIRSVLSQTYAHVELIVVDDASTDNSQSAIREAIGNRDIRFIRLSENIGNCAAFNRGLEISTGAYVIDLAADDLLLPSRIETGVRDFSKASDKAGVHFSDAFIINETGDVLRTHYRRDSHGQLAETVPSGNLYLDLVRKYFICPPTMMIRRRVLEALGGYDESLHYEDFDFWVRSSREFDYLFNKAPLVKKRIVRGSHGMSQSRLRNHHQESTLKVCKKIYSLNKSPEEDEALLWRCNYEIRQSLKTLNVGLVPKFKTLKKLVQRRLSSSSSMDR